MSLKAVLEAIELLDSGTVTGGAVARVLGDAGLADVTVTPFTGEEVRPETEAMLSVATARGNRAINHRGIAISATVRAGWILRVSEDLITIMQNVTGRPAVVFPLTMQDITPYGNGLYHINSI